MGRDGWIILVVLVAIGLLAYFGIFSPDRFLPERCIIDSTSEMFCSDFEVSSSVNAVGIEVKNTRDTGILVENSLIGGCEQREEVIIDAGESKVVIFDCEESLVEGDRFEEKINLTFVSLETRFSANGLVSGKIE